MTIFLWIVFGIITVLLLLVASMRPNQPSRSRFEVARLAGKGDAAAVRDEARYQVFDDIMTLQRIVSALLMVVVIVMSVIQLGWLFGVIVAVIVVLEYPVIARLPIITLYGRNSRCRRSGRRWCSKRRIRFDSGTASPSNLLATPVPMPISTDYAVSV